MTKTKDAPPAPTPLEEAKAAEDVDFWEQWGDLGPGRQVEINREPGRVYLGTVPLDESFNPDLIQDRWGGGKFSFRARENGKFLKGHPTKFLEIEGDAKVAKLPQVLEDTPEVMALRAKLVELTGGEPKPAAVADNVMVAVVGMMAPLLTAIVSQAMDRPPQSSPTEILDLARKLAKDAREAAPANEPGSFDPIERLGLPLLTEIREMRKIEAGKNGDGVATPSEVEAIGPPDAANPPTARVPATMQELAEFVAQWCAPHVARGASPGLRAEVLLEDLAMQNPPLLAQVVNLSRLDDVLEHWGAMVPAVAAAKEWHGEFISEVRRFSDEPAEGVDDPPDSEGGPGDAGDGGGDGTPIESGGQG